MERLILRDGVWHARVESPTGEVEYKTTGCRLIEDAIQSVQESKLIELETVGKITNLTHSVISHITVGKDLSNAEAIDSYLEHLSFHASPKHTHNARIALRQWIRKSQCSRCHPMAVSERHVNAFVNDSSKVSAGTRVLRLTYIAKFFDYCRENGWVTRNPARIVKVNRRALSHKQKEKRTSKFYTAEEVADILSKIDSEIVRETKIKVLGQLMFWRFSIEIAFITGLRFVDVLLAEWDSFSDVVAIHTSKTGKRVAPEESERLKEIVAKIPRNGKHLFPRNAAAALNPTNSARICMQFKRLCKKIGVEYKGLHALRHGKATQMAASGRSMREIAAALGHSLERTTAVYVHHPIAASPSQNH